MPPETFFNSSSVSLFGSFCRNSSFFPFGVLFASLIVLFLPLANKVALIRLSGHRLPRGNLFFRTSGSVRGFSLQSQSSTLGKRPDMSASRSIWYAMPASPLKNPGTNIDSVEPIIE